LDRTTLSSEENESEHVTKALTSIFYYNKTAIATAMREKKAVTEKAEETVGGIVAG
jgi:hypothetical protein